jgi:selenocysteine lyase/cysteine desulfurase
MVAEVNAGRAPEARALLCVDGVHGFGAVDLPVAELGCDFLSTGTHKWLFGPRGTGVLWGKPWDALDPVIPTFSSGDSPAARFTPGGYHSFEHRWALKEAFELHAAIGRTRIAERIAIQATRLKEGLAKVPSVRLITPDDPDMSAGIVCCEVDGMDAYSAVVMLRQAGVVASVTPYERQYLRFGPSIVTTPEQMDRVVDAVRELRP